MEKQCFQLLSVVETATILCFLHQLSSVGAPDIFFADSETY